MILRRVLTLYLPLLFSLQLTALLLNNPKQEPVLQATPSAVPQVPAPDTTTTTEAPTSTTEPSHGETPEQPQQEAEEPCAAALRGANAVGIPEGFNFYCSAAYTDGHAGTVQFWHSGCCENFIAINPHTGNYSGVGAHEACHALQLVTTGDTTEQAADQCAAEHGYPNPYA